MLNIDQQFFKDTTPWTMGGENIKVVEDNEHLGQIVSGSDQISKNIDLRLRKGRGSLYGLLGPGFAYKCLLSPLVKLHLYRTYVCPIIRSGLSSFSIRQNSLHEPSKSIYFVVVVVEEFVETEVLKTETVLLIQEHIIGRKKTTYNLGDKQSCTIGFQAS